jgi:glycosyltransferase involved in cell wall biosynthesis
LLTNCGQVSKEQGRSQFVRHEDIRQREAQDAASATPWLSVILPTYCGEQWVETTLQSIAIDPDPGIEVIVIDTSPNSATLDMVVKFADRLNLSIFQPADIDGCTLKTNFGVEQARASHVTWLCQDDVWLPGRAQALRRWITADPGAALHLAPTAIIDVNGKVLGIWRCPLADGEAPLDRETLCTRLLVQNFVATPSPVVRRDAWLACGGIDLALWYTGDWELWLKLAQHGRSYYHDEVTAGFRIHGASATSTGSRDAADFRSQHELVIDRHMGAITPARRARIRRIADVSVTVNVALAAAANGAGRGLARALRDVLALGPVDGWRYLRYSRIVERSWPRLRAKLAGSL